MGGARLNPIKIAYFAGNELASLRGEFAALVNHGKSIGTQILLGYK